jgi:hypothetical protein
MKIAKWSTAKNPFPQLKEPAFLEICSIERRSLPSCEDANVLRRIGLEGGAVVK